MKALTYYLSLPFIYFVSFSPFWFLYRISDFIYFILAVLVGYRKKVILENLKNAFPNKSDEELLTICKKYYRYLGDLVVESLKAITMSESYVKKHFKINNVALLDALYDKGKSFVLVMGHYGNWEMAGPAFALLCKHQLNVVYKPLSNRHYESFFSRSRTRFSTKIIPMNNTLRAMAANRKVVDATALIADQTPSDVKNAHWLEFLNQDTVVFNGPEKIAKMFDYPVVYMKVDRVRRGYYEVTPTVITNEPKKTNDLEITKVFHKILEADIKSKPEIWLWSHRRWKHKRESNS